MNKYIKILLLLLLGITSCKKDKKEEPSDDNVVIKKEGFILATKTPSNSFLVKYLPSLPKGEVDMEGTKDFQNFYIDDSFEGAIYLRNPDASPGLAKYGVNENGDIVRIGELSTIGRADPVHIRDAEKGVCFDYGERKEITVFNPTDMTFSGNIDMSQAIFPNKDDLTRYRQIYIRDNLFFAPLGNNSSPVWYDPLVIHVADIDKGTYEKSIEIELGGPVRHNQFFGGQYIDEDGSLYITDIGDILSLTPAILHKISPGSTDIDQSFEFNICRALNEENIYFNVYNCFYVIGKNKAIALVIEDTPENVISALELANGDPSQLTNSQINFFQNQYATMDNAAWCEIDLKSKTVSRIPGIPSQNIEKRFTITKDGDKWLLPVENNNEDAYYSYNPQTGEVKKEFDISGGVPKYLINLANNH